MYTITFNSNGGTTIADLTEQTALPNPLPTTTKSGYTFVNWYYDSAFTQIATAGDTIESDVTLYAKWQLNTYTITFEENGGTSVTDLTEQTELPTPLPTTTKSGYTFVAWYYESNFQTRAKAGDTIESNVTLYAKWHNLGSLFTEIADAIRSKDGTSENIRDVDFGERVNAIQGAKEEETKTVTPNFSSGNVVVTPTSGKVMTQVTINKDTTNHIADNIKDGVTLYGVTGTYEGGMPLEEFVQFRTADGGGTSYYRLLTFLSRNPHGWGTPVNIKIYYDSGGSDVLLVSKEISFDRVNFIVIPRSYGVLKIVMSLVPDDDYGWNGFSGFYAKTATPNVVTQLTAPSGQDDFVLSYIDFDVFHVVFTAYGD